MAEKEKPREYVVVTRYQKTPQSRPLVHTYGMYGQSKAKSVKSNMKAEHQRMGLPGTLEISVCHIIDIDRMNQGLAAAMVRDTVLQ